MARYDRMMRRSRKQYRMMRRMKGMRRRSHQRRGSPFRSLIGLALLGAIVYFFGRTMGWW